VFSFVVEDYEKFPIGKKSGDKNMRKKQRRIICMLLMMAGFIALGANTAVALDETDLFVTLDSSWEHANEGDTFVVRADVKNIGEHPALITWIRLENIPDDWDVQQPQHLILILPPGETQSSFFVVERGATDATIYATAYAYNAPAVQSNRIAIPINLWIVAGLSLVCGVVAYREVKTRKKQKK
jgi:hypothetical protein